MASCTDFDCCYVCCFGGGRKEILSRSSVRSGLAPAGAVPWQWEAGSPSRLAPPAPAQSLCLKTPSCSPPDPEPAEAQAGEEEAAAAGGEAGHAGPAPEDTRAAESSHRLSWQTGHRDAQPAQPGLLRIPLLSGGNSSARQAGVAAWALGVGQTVGQSWGGLHSAVTRRNQLLDSSLPCEVGVWLGAGRTASPAQICFLFIKMKGTDPESPPMAHGGAGGSGSGPSLRRGRSPSAFLGLQSALAPRPLSIPRPPRGVSPHWG